MTSSLRIAFTGAAGTGKTTLAKFVEEKFGIPWNPVGSRSTAEKLNLASPYDADKTCMVCKQFYSTNTPKVCPGHTHEFKSMRAIFQHQMMEDKFEWEESHLQDGFVTDRTYLDQWIYSVMHEPSMVIPSYLKTMFECSARVDYSLVIYLPITAFCDVVGDPKRIHSMPYHHRYDELLQSALCLRVIPDARLKVLQLSSLGVRMEAVKGWIEQLL